MTWDDGLRPCRPEDRLHVHAVLRRHLQAADVPYTVHPGDWDWWESHPDPRVPAPLRLVGNDAVVHLAADGELASVGLPRQRWAHLPDAVRSVGWIGARDGEAQAALAQAGFAPAARTFTLFERAVGPLPTVPAPPPGYEVGLLGLGAKPEQSRADAARLAFASTMEPAAHRARYRAFMRSPGYTWARDTVAVAADTGDVAAFAVTWPDTETSLALFEPVGTHPDHQRRGLGRAVLGACLRDLAGLGIERARVCSWTDNAASMALYESAGFAAVDTLSWWER